ncbi:hypothetical protein AYX14_01608 [Cryptococcus neoformans]|nr:hypothetical protein AYX14_01608 [Cryptococcus neoformans var. grubii]
MLGPLVHIPRILRLALLCAFIVIVPTLYLLYPSEERLPAPGEWQAGGIDSEHWREPVKPDFARYEHEEGRAWGEELLAQKEASVAMDDDVIHGGVIMPKLGNATAKAELGRAAWRVLHLMTLRYPDEPTEDDRLALKSFFHLFSRLYPCGECAQEFQNLLKDYPPQTSSRKSASLWLCHVHNQVNARLGKPEFDCLTLDETYDCGCGDDANMPSSVSIASSPSAVTESSDTNGINVVKAMTEAVDDPIILSHGGAALQGEFEVAASGEGVGLSAEEVDEKKLLEKEEKGIISQEQVGDHEWRKSQIIKEEEWEKEMANHGLD